MKHLPRQDKLALEKCVNNLKEIANMNINYEIYESPSLYIIYLDDKVFNILEDEIDKILDNNYKYLTINKEILISPKSFIASYERKLEAI